MSGSEKVGAASRIVTRYSSLSQLEHIGAVLHTDQASSSDFDKP
jgi:hypothetical protein